MNRILYGGNACDARKCVSTKIGPLPEDFYETAVKEADITLIEADGSRGMPAKIPADYEPVIPENIDEIHIVIGMSALGKPASKVVHRLH